MYFSMLYTLQISNKLNKGCTSYGVFSTCHKKKNKKMSKKMQRKEHKSFLKDICLDRFSSNLVCKVSHPEGVSTAKIFCFHASITNS